MAVINPEAKKLRSRFGTALVWVCTPAPAIISYMSDWSEAADSDLHLAVKWLIGAVDRHSVGLVTAALGGLVVGKYFSTEEERQRIRAVQALLDKVRDCVFPDSADAHEAEHRVTLFRWRRFCWGARRYPSIAAMWSPRLWTHAPWTGWLEPYLRSGVMGKGVAGSIFLAPKRHSQEADGMAGRAWSLSKVVTVTKLPAITSASSSAQVKKYSERTFTSTGFIQNYLKRGRALPRSLVGFRVETSAGEPWGSIVIDSVDPDAISEEQVVLALELVQKPLAILLEGL